LGTTQGKGQLWGKRAQTFPRFPGFGVINFILKGSKGQPGLKFSFKAPFFFPPGFRRLFLNPFCWNFGGPFGPVGGFGREGQVKRNSPTRGLGPLWVSPQTPRGFPTRGASQGFPKGLPFPGKHIGSLWGFVPPCGAGPSLVASFPFWDFFFAACVFFVKLPPREETGLPPWKGFSPHLVFWREKNPLFFSPSSLEFLKGSGFSTPRKGGHMRYLKGGFFPRRTTGFFTRVEFSPGDPFSRAWFLYIGSFFGAAKGVLPK